VTIEPDPREAWHQQMQVYAAHGPTDRSRSWRYYAGAGLVIVGSVLAALVLAEAIPQEGPPPTTVPPLTFPTNQP
jgi:hypothetical protein